MAIGTEGFGNYLTSDTAIKRKVGASGEYQPSASMVTLADGETGTGEISVWAVLPSKKTFQINNPNGASVRIDVSNDPNLGWNQNYIVTSSTEDWYSVDEPWHYVRVYIDSQPSPASSVTVKMGV